MKFIICLIWLIGNTALAEDNHHDHNKHDHEKKSLKAHEHGVSLLNIVQDDNNIVFEFVMPGFDIVGFEYKAKKKEDIKKVKSALKSLSSHNSMLKLPNSGECTIENSSASVFNEGSHSEFKSEYAFICKNISSIKKIQIHFLKNFKYSKKLSINLIAKNKNLAQIIDKSKVNLNVDGYF